MPTASVESNDSIAGSNRAMEEELCQMHRHWIEPVKPAVATEGLGSRIHNLFGRLWGVELEMPSRNDTPKAPDLTREATSTLP